jgi:TPP-dependent pyruvate/acetoin dehydrogenase alpha subunit
MVAFETGRVGAAFPGRGDQLGVGQADCRTSSHPCTVGRYVFRGITLRRMFANLLGRDGINRVATNCTASRPDLGIFFISACPVLPGGLARHVLPLCDERVAVTFTGDGASNAGLFTNAEHATFTTFCGSRE